MPGSGPRRTAKELEAAYLQAYRHWCDGMGPNEIAATMAGPPHWCGGHGTVSGKEGWINRGRRIEAERGVLAKRQAQRERVAAAYNQLRVVVELEMKAGLIPRIHGRRFQEVLLTRYAQLMGLPMPAEVEVTGDVTTHSPEVADLVKSLAAAVGDQLPDREEDHR